jgi:N6-adenosine-specific RNA methylase IME4
MPLEKLLELPVAQLADEDCHVYLWITNRSLPKGFALLERWGFRYITTLTWCKPSFGMGTYFRGSTEHVLFAVKGSQPLKRKDVGSWFQAPRGPLGHSSKPAEFYDLVESCSPGPYLEMFARSPRSGWSVWGAEVDGH